MIALEGACGVHVGVWLRAAATGHCHGVRHSQIDRNSANKIYHLRPKKVVLSYEKIAATSRFSKSLLDMGFRTEKNRVTGIGLETCSRTRDE